MLGVVSGTVAVLIRRGLEGMQWLYTQHGGTLPAAARSLPDWRRVGTPVLGAALCLALLHLLRGWVGDETSEDYADAIQANRPILFRPSVRRMASAALNLAAGATVGREGAMMQFATACSSLAVRLRPKSFGQPHHHLTYALSGAVASVYRAPLAAVFFALEIGRGKLVLQELPPCAVASVVSYGVTCLLLQGGPIFPLAMQPATNGPAWLCALAAAALLTVAAPLYYHLLRGAEILKKLPMALVWSGVAVGLLGLLRAEVWGNGDQGLLSLTHADWVLGTACFVLVLRLLSSVICVGAGAIGGVFTPTCFLGGATGYAVAALAVKYLRVLGGDATAANHVLLLCTVIGIGALLAAVTHAPLMSACMAVELTGAWRLLLPLLCISIVAALISRRIEPQSLYGIATGSPAPRPADQPRPRRPGDDVL